LRAAERLLNDQSQGADFYNLANGHGFSVPEVIYACRKVMGEPIQYRAEARRAGDPTVLVGDARLAAEVLVWTPKCVDLDKIIGMAWNYIIKTHRDIKLITKKEMSFYLLSMMVDVLVHQYYCSIYLLG
jgi:UDP-glucose 4-epimerase